MVSYMYISHRVAVSSFCIAVSMFTIFSLDLLNYAYIDIIVSYTSSYFDVCIHSRLSGSPP